MFFALQLPDVYSADLMNLIGSLVSEMILNCTPVLFRHMQSF